jgi:hypothetical protein
MAPLIDNLLTNTNVFVADAGGSVTRVLNSMEPWGSRVLSLLGGLLFIYMIIKFVISRSKGTASGGSMIGQVVVGLFALMILFNPTFIATIADGAMTVFSSIFEMFTDPVT